jgi:hypothetical protein
MHFCRLLTVVIMASGLAAPALAQTAGTSGSTTVVDQFTVDKNSDLGFGSVLPPTSGTNVIEINPASGVRSITGGGNATLIGSGGVSRATYTVSGDGGQTFVINLPSTFQITRQGGSETITVSLVASGPGGTLSNSTGTAGTANFGVGGTFPISSSTAIGHYQGTFAATVNNN